MVMIMMEVNDCYRAGDNDDNHNDDVTDDEFDVSLMILSIIMIWHVSDNRTKKKKLLWAK